MPFESPKVFISYSHDSGEHEKSVLALANRLRGDGLDASLDQYENFPRQGWIRWMKEQVRDARFVLVVCTETYKRRTDGEEKTGVGLGAIFESQLIQQLLYDESGLNEKFVPVVLSDRDRQHIPVEVRRYTYFPVHTEDGYQALYRLLTNQPGIQKPVIGARRALPAREAKPDFQNVVWNVPPRNPFFTGRDAYLEALREALAQKGAAALTHPPAISGLGGVGKTQTAIEYAHRYRAVYTAVLWSAADSRESVLSGFAVLAQLLNVPEKDEQDLSVVAAGVRHWLETNSGWLLIFDNVEDLTVRDFAPAVGEGHLLLTTRLRATGEFAERVELKKMTREEGAVFLLRRAKLIPKNGLLDAASEVDRVAALQISEEVDGLPLALDQAGAFIEEVPSTPAEYLALYRAEGASLRARRGSLVGGHTSVTVTFSLAFARIVDANFAAAELVRSCAFLAPEAIPEEIFTEGGRHLGKPIAELVGKPLAWVSAIEEAGRFALISRYAEAKSLTIHRIVQEVIRDGMDVRTCHSCVQRLIEALCEIFPNEEYQNWPACERLLPHATACAEWVAKWGIETHEAAALLDVGARYLLRRADYSAAEPLFRQALGISEKVLGHEHVDTIAALENLAGLYFCQARYADAELLYNQTLPIIERMLGPEHPDTAQSLNNLALVYHRQARYADAEPLYRRALSLREHALGAEHPETAATLNNLGRLYDEQGRHADAQPLLRHALAIRERALGPEHPQTAQSLNNLARLYDEQCRYGDAEPLYRRALVIMEKVLGPEHTDVATTLNNLALLYHHQGRYADAEPLYRRALTITEKSLGPEHPYCAASVHNIAWLYYDQGRYADAEPLYRRALTIMEKSLGLEHPFAVTVIRNYAGLLRKLGRMGDARQLEARLKVRP